MADDCRQAECFLSLWARAVKRGSRNGPFSQAMGEIFQRLAPLEALGRSGALFLPEAAELVEYLEKADQQEGQQQDQVRS